MDHTQGVAANLITATLVLSASQLGVPVSTTHVSVGSIVGAGAGADALNRDALRSVLLSWVATLPLAAGIAWIALKIS
jgi:PiT family inorganic phosphate transporter